MEFWRIFCKVYLQGYDDESLIHLKIQKGSQGIWKHVKKPLFLAVNGT